MERCHPTRIQLGSNSDRNTNHVDLSLVCIYGELPVDIDRNTSHGHQLTYNATKSFTLCFKPKHIKIGIPDFVGKLVIPAVDKCKYL